MHALSHYHHIINTTGNEQVSRMATRSRLYHYTTTFFNCKQVKEQVKELRKESSKQRAIRCGHRMNLANGLLLRVYL